MKPLAAGIGLVLILFCYVKEANSLCCLAFGLVSWLVGCLAAWFVRLVDLLALLACLLASKVCRSRVVRRAGSKTCPFWIAQGDVTNEETTSAFLFCHQLCLN